MTATCFSSRTALLLAAGLLALLPAACSLTLETIPRTDGSRFDAFFAETADGASALDGDAADATGDARRDADDVEVVCTPSPERCNGLDDDCNGRVDDGIPARSCGVGACLRTAAGCLDGAVPACTAGTPADETCNGIDDDCDGTVDDSLVNQTCGVGACAATVPACVAGVVPACVAGSASPESCNAIDDDCDGAVDNGLLPQTCGVGACAVTVPGCVGGVVPGCAPGSGSAEVCNGIDDDCDGTVDDGFANITCGTGACVNTVPGCTGGSVPTCVPRPPSTETCNGVDDDCDGVVDNRIAPTRCGVGACARVATCTAGATSCAAGSPQRELCNNIDDDCNGLVDDGIPGVTCGFGACRRTFVSGCSAGVPVTCGPPTTVTEVCADGVDNNCDGRVDENCPTFCTRYVALSGTAAGDGLTPSTPRNSIQAAIDSVPAGVIARVCVAANSNGGCTVAPYPETVTMHEGVSVFGGYDPTTWTRGNPQCATNIVPGAPAGVFFGHGITNATQLDGFTILAMSGVTGSTAVAAVTMQEGGTLTNNVITGAVAASSIGVNLVAPAGTVAHPVIAMNTISAAGGSIVVDSVGIRATVIGPEIRGNASITSGFATRLSAGIDLSSAPGTVIADNPSIVAGNAPQTAGIRAGGDVSSVVITRNQVRGGSATLATNPARGILLGSCTAGTATVLANGNITGSNGSLVAVGVDVLGCSVAIVANASIVGSTSGGVGADATAIHCGMVGTTCDIQRNASLVGFGGAATGTGPTGTGRGVWVNNFALARVVGNRGFVSCTQIGSQNCNAIVVDTASTTGTLIDSNVIDVQRGTWSNGIFGSATAFTISNNLVFANATTGINLDTRFGASQEPVVHSNTVVGLSGSAFSSGATNLISVSDESVFTAPVGVFRNNIAVCLGTSTNRFAFAEYGAYADPRVLENNDFWGCETLYRDVDTGALITAIGTVNALTDVPTRSGNVSLDPAFVSATPVSPADFHLRATSPLVDIGTRAGVPLFDFDPQPRPGLFGYDIGFDEVVP